MFAPSGASVRISSEGRRALVQGYEAALDRAVRSRHSDRKVSMRRLMLEEARALAWHMRAPADRPFQPQVQDY
ncbi:hypothetical protein [Salipiger abyssi]|uniref:hypothetical protein n=1 Tax=Salipiger abyssi TaxID=1250539 RepID=UPI001A8CB5E7|nr:hypothetical protein [Salipiger abyssi]MBN9890542.1 hypothetical protein [Salipiger abyssi]